MKEQELMARAPVRKAVFAMAVPSVISSLVTVVYNLADTFFVGQTGDPLQVAAVSLTNPIFILLMAFTNILGLGGSALISTALGRQDPKRAKQIGSFAIYGSLAAGVVIMVILFAGMSPILTLFGANEETYLMAEGYTRYIAIGAPFIIASATASVIVRSEGASKEAMIGSMVGTVTNIVLDPIFISVLGWGAAGAALATTVGNLLACAYFLWFFLRKAHVLSIHPKWFHMGDGIFSGVVSTGMPSGILSVLMSISTIVLNQILVVYGNAPVAAIGIVFKANMFIAFSQMGIANGVQPLLGYNFGSGDWERYQKVARFTRLCCIVTGCACTALYLIFREPIIHAFINDAEVSRYGVQMLIAYSLAGPFLGILFTNINCLQTVGHPTPATILSILRQGALLIPALYLLQAVLGLNGVIYAQSITDVITVVLSCVLWGRCRAKCRP